MGQATSDSGEFNLRDKDSATISYVIPFSSLASFASSTLKATHPWRSNLIAKQITYEPLRNIDGGGFVDAVVNVNYGINDSIEYNLDMTVETVSLPKQCFKWDSGSGTSMADDERAPHPFKLIPSDTIEITYNDISDIPYDEIDGNRGKTNEAAWTVDGHEYAIDQVLFLGAKTTNQQDSSGNHTYRVTLLFAARPGDATWQMLWSVDPDVNGGVGQWRVVNPALYDQGDFTELDFS